MHIYICLYICIHTYIHACIHTYMAYIHTCLHTNTHTYTCMSVCIYIYTWLCICIHSHNQVNVYVPYFVHFTAVHCARSLRSDMLHFLYVRIYIYTHTHIQIQIYAPPHVCRYPLRVPVVILQGAIKCLVLSLFQGSTTASPQLRV